MCKEEKIVLNRKKKLKGSGSRDFNSDFVFRERDTLTCDDAWVSADVMKQLKIKVCVCTCVMPFGPPPYAPPFWFQ